ncbi:MAG: peptidyl-prolyl cis-trans isomerase [Candidatus Omnitrophota bacterium]
MRYSAWVIRRGLKWGALTILFTSSIFLLGCDKIDFLNPKKPSAKAKAPAHTVKGTVIAKVNNIPITLEELNRYIEIYNASIGLRQDFTEEQKQTLKIDTREKKIDYLKTLLIRQTVFYQAALDRGLDRRDEINEILERYKVAILAQAMQDEIVKNLETSSAEAEDAYKNNLDLFKEAQVRKVREIVARTEDEAKQMLIELLQGGDFASIARSRSIVESAKNGGDLGEIKIGRLESFPEFDGVVFSPALQQGQVSSIFKGPKGYYLVKVEAIKEGRQVPFSEAFDTLKAYLLAQKQQMELDKAYDKFYAEDKVEIYEGEIK